MNPLECALIEKTGNDNGFEHTLEQDASTVTLASARHRTRAQVSPIPGGFAVRFQAASSALLPELERNYGQNSKDDGALFVAPSLADLSNLLRRAAGLSQALPSQAADDYQLAIEKELTLLPAELGGTEVERIVRQRIGQDRFRAALFDYWGGACAVTGVALPEVLRASHTKPWAECDCDAERLDVFNGFLLVANLDALFDRFLISFDNAGRLLISDHLDQRQLQQLGIYPEMTLRWLTDAHRSYLDCHRVRFRQLISASSSMSPDYGESLFL